ncbi:MAG: bifunctional 3'-5' exonuclease/DNA polymerase, partial [Thermus sp.]
MPIDLEKLARELGLEDYPAHPARESTTGREAFRERENSPRTRHPAPTRQDPSDPGTPPVAGCAPGGAGELLEGVPGKDLPDKKGPKTPLEGTVPGLPGGVSGGVISTARRGGALLFLEETGEKLGEVLDQLLSWPYLGMDLETTGLDPHTAKPRLLSLAAKGLVVVMDLFRVPLEALAPLFGEKGPVLVGHNLKFDLGFLLKAGVWQGSGKRLWDVGLVHQVLHVQAHMPALKDLVPLDKTMQTSDWSGPLSREQLVYAAMDAAVPLGLYQEQRERARDLGLEQVLEVEHRALPAVAWMELAGVPFDPVLWEEAAREAEEKARKLLGDLPSEVNWNSPQQALRYLEEEGLHLENTREESLAEHRDHPLVAKLLAYREAAKRASTYGKAWSK